MLTSDEAFLFPEVSDDLRPAQRKKPNNLVNFMVEVWLLKVDCAPALKYRWTLFRHITWKKRLFQLRFEVIEPPDNVTCRASNLIYWRYVEVAVCLFGKETARNRLVQRFPPGVLHAVATFSTREARLQYSRWKIWDIQVELERLRHFRCKIIGPLRWIESW